MLRYPTGKLGTKEEYDKLWYDAQGFGVKTSYGYHDGRDFNLKSGGDTDLGEPLYAVYGGKIVYYHDATHPTTNFGRHMVLECDIPGIGKRWYHYAHCQSITASAKQVTKGEVIGKLGKSGTTWAHLHFSVFKVDPKGLRNGIDTIAKTTNELNNWWEDPFLTLNLQLKEDDNMLPQWFENLLKERNLSLEREGEFREFWGKAVNYDDKIKGFNEQVRLLQEQVKSANEALSDRALEVSILTEKNQQLSDRKEEAEELLNKTKSERDQALWENDKLQIEVKTLYEEIESLQEEIDRHKSNNNIYAYSWRDRFLSLFGR